MTIKKVQIIPPNYTDIIHPETDSSVVLMGSGKTLQTVSNRSQRFVIGISTAGWTLDDCDYLCDGVDDQVEINNAITALPVNGGEIVILDGTYNITAKIDVNKDYVRIKGNGNATKLIRNWNSSSSEGIVAINSANYCKIENLYIDGKNIIYSSNNNSGIRIFQGDNNIIRYNTILNSMYNLSLSTSKYNFINSNICRDGEIGIYLYSSDRNMIINNTSIRGNGSPEDYIPLRYTILLQGALNNYNFISSNNCIGKDVSVAGGIGNTVINNKWNETSDFEDLSTQVDTNKTDILSAKTTLGSVAMTTTAQTATGAINELDADIGNKATLTTDVKTNLVNAINEHEAQINDLGAKVIAESGSNANGSYIKFEDGTMICNHLVTAVYASNWTMGANWVFPATFSANPNVFATYTQGGTLANDTLAKALPLRIVDLTAYNCNVNILEVDGGFVDSDTIPVFALSIGRWK